VVRPVIFVPESVISDHGSIESVIAHEMAHVARWDALWLGLQNFVHAAFFFHPLVWIAGVRLDSARENLCDATVVAAGRIRARTYVGGLLNVLQLDLQGVGAPTMTSRKRRIDVRIRRVLASDGAPRPRLAAATAVVFLIATFVLPLGPGGPVASGDESSPRPPGEDRLASNREVSDFANPLPGGRVTWRWGKGLDPWTKEEVFHRGIDIAAEAGTVVRAPADGVIVVATETFEQSPASGTVILIDHGDGWTTFYAHLGSLEVAEKQKVSKNDVIAVVGSTGKSTGPHLHFEIRHDGEHVNPAEFVNDWK
jgi:murein DD-endopeptidase MepM/ murein hydrolase activator NlpD